MYEWYENKPQFFDKVVHNRPEGDNDIVARVQSVLIALVDLHLVKFEDGSYEDVAAVALQLCGEL